MIEYFNDYYDECKQITDIYLAMSKDVKDITSIERINILAHCMRKSKRDGVNRLMRDILNVKKGEDL